jgi:hypothetical protein
MGVVVVCLVGDESETLWAVWAVDFSAVLSAHNNYLIRSIDSLPQIHCTFHLPEEEDVTTPSLCNPHLSPEERNEYRMQWKIMPYLSECRYSGVGVG